MRPNTWKLISSILSVSERAYRTTQRGNPINKQQNHLLSEPGHHCQSHTLLREGLNEKYTLTIKETQTLNKVTRLKSHTQEVTQKKKGKTTKLVYFLNLVMTSSRWTVCVQLHH